MATAEAPETLAKPEKTEVPTQEMEIVVQGNDAEAVNGGGIKRGREEADGDDNGNDDTKKSKLDTSVEEQRLERVDEEKKEDKQLDLVPEQGKVTVGLKSFGSSVEMFDYFYNFLHAWAPDLDVNKYEHIMLLELIKKGHSEPDIKIGPGIRAFQIRFHPRFKSRCFFIIREDDSEDDFSFRKCVNQILPLPENMQIRDDINKALGRGWGRGRGGGGGGGGGGGSGRGHSRGRGSRPRN